MIAVIDPRRSEVVEGTDIWLRPRPGTDVALALGVIRYIIEHGYIERDFIDEWTYDYELFKEEVMKWTPERVEEVTRVRWELIEELGEAYGRLKPSATMIGIGLQKSLNGAECVRAIALIPALLGYHRGFYYSNSKGWQVDISYITGEALSSVKSDVVSQVSLSEHIKRGDFKFIYVYNMNPAITLPDQNALREGLLREDVFVVVHETRWIETLEYADVVLPAPTYLEKDDVVLPYSHGYVRLSRRAIKPLGESKGEIWVMREIARRLHLAEEWILEDPWEALRRAFKNALEDGSFEDLIKGRLLKLRYKPLHEYQTPTGKIELLMN